ncbi:hypothetical protein BDP27DRAFT_301817 [Rhodocollybia butyracea]|uniref:Uncharacterized protein n=1 Tax=Rhodocollybia butyracea TaxID=206335 RepID=A0A9P5Q243_9AGAR|nr:hypothetical protein BDP27DRAFT_301817 [Rhodocollybia butyracea]
MLCYTVRTLVGRATRRFIISLLKHVVYSKRNGTSSQTFEIVSRAHHLAFENTLTSNSAQIIAISKEESFTFIGIDINRVDNYHVLSPQCQNVDSFSIVPAQQLRHSESLVTTVPSLALRSRHNLIFDLSRILHSSGNHRTVHGDVITPSVFVRTWAFVTTTDVVQISAFGAREIAFEVSNSHVQLPISWIFNDLNSYPHYAS